MFTPIAAALVVGGVITGLAVQSTTASPSLQAESTTQTAEVEAPDTNFAPAADAEATLQPEIEAFEGELPEGVTWLDDLGFSDQSARSGEPSEMFVEDGFVANTVKMYWLCSWENELVVGTDAHDADRIAAATAALRQFVDRGWYEQVYDDPQRVWYNYVAAPAFDGDVTAMRDEVKGCGFTFPE